MIASLTGQTHDRSFFYFNGVHKFFALQAPKNESIPILVGRTSKKIKSFSSKNHHEKSEDIVLAGNSDDIFIESGQHSNNDIHPSELVPSVERMKLLGVVFDQPTIVTTLRALGLTVRAPLIAPARSRQLIDCGNSNDWTKADLDYGRADNQWTPSASKKTHKQSRFSQCALVSRYFLKSRS